MVSKLKIIQMMSANPTWKAVYTHPKDADQRFNGKAWHTYPVEAWALVEVERREVTETLVMGMALKGQMPEYLELIDPDEDEDFLTYTRVDEGYDWQVEAVDQRERREAERKERRR